jgi:hypothetical protein
MPLGLRKKITQPPAKIYPSVAIGWLHADSLNRERDEEMAEKKIGEEYNQGNPDQKRWSERRKKELSNLLTESHPK